MPSLTTFSRIALLASALALSAPPPLQAQESPPGLTATSLVRVVDGDTLHVLRDGRREKLRLLGIDTEEVYDSGSKPVTAMGRAASAHLKGLLHCNADGNPVDPASPARIDLQFETTGEERDTFGRLLCYAWYRGKNLNLHVIEVGYSPYFTKYGYSRSHHEAMHRAQIQASEARLGIWGDRPEGEPDRDYARLLPWWNARAEALRAAEGPLASGEWIDARDEQGLRSHANQDTVLFGALMEVRFTRGTVKALIESTQALRVELEIPKELVGPELRNRLVEHLADGATNFVTGRGKLEVRGKWGVVKVQAIEGLRLF